MKTIKMDFTSIEKAKARAREELKQRIIPIISETISAAKREKSDEVAMFYGDGYRDVRECPKPLEIAEKILQELEK